MTETVTIPRAELESLIAQRDAALAESARLTELLADYEEGPNVEPEPVELSFHTFDEAEVYVLANGWPRKEHTADTRWLAGISPRGVDTRPYASIWVAGNEYHFKKPQAGPEWYHIAHSAVEDVTRATVWFDPAGVPWTGDQAQMEKNLRDYRGGLNNGFVGWPEWAVRAYLETHDWPERPLRRQIPVTRGG